MEIELSCYFCDKNITIKVEGCEGWGVRYNVIGTERAFCPDHSDILKFAENQCPGCVGCFCDCDLFRSFEKRASRTITNHDLFMLEKGICPKRTNGTFDIDFRSKKLSEINISDVATAESGKKLAKAIREYIKKYN